MGAMANTTFTLRSGRRLGYTTFGDPDSERIVVFCHPAPGSSMFDPDPVVTAQRGVHILAFDRPGYGSSDPLPSGIWPSVVQPAEDIAEFLRYMNTAEAAVGLNGPRVAGAVGWSAGGRVALALAARHPELVDRVAVVATPAPNEHVPWIAPQVQAMSDHLGTLPPDDAIGQLSEMLQPQADAILAADEVGEVPLDALGASAVDVNALAAPGVRDRLGRMLRDAFTQGPRGVAADILSYTARPWGFDFADVRARVLVVAGQADALAGSAHADWYRDALPDARAEVVPGVGHLVVVPQWERILAHVAPSGVS